MFITILSTIEMPRRNKAFLLVGLSVILLYLAILFRRPPQQPDLDFDADGYGDGE